MESTADAALEAIRKEPADAIVLTPELPGSSIAVLTEQLLAEPNAAGRPIFLYFPAPATPEDQERWKQFAHEFELHAVESLPQLAEGLVRATCVALDKLPEHGQKLLSGTNETSRVLAGKKIMIVDDDIRNIFALSSTLEQHDVSTVSAETGRDAINLLQAAADVDIVLMDIMMPEMDGIDTMRAIRQIPHFKGLPIIAVTAKAMKGDREKCIDAGAWDYLSKPVDSEHLLKVLRAWLTV
jgi:CheY-like chemotaxis protein